ncbi:MAG: acylphosphatase [Gammaproteobacteria bacterium]
MNEETEQETETADETAENAAYAAKYRLTGDVQNVGFRNYLARTAEELSVRGWAKNESDGSLVVLLCGEESAVSQMLPHLQQGPIGAMVSNMTELLVEDEDAPPEDFQTR